MFLYLQINKYQDTNILEIRATTTDPEEAKMMANTLAGIMVVENQNQMRAEYKSARRFLQDKIQEFKHKFDTALLNLKDFRKKEKTNADTYKT